jgi:hypothetical protein
LKKRRTELAKKLHTIQSTIARIEQENKMITSHQLWANNSFVNIYALHATKGGAING